MHPLLLLGSQPGLHQHQVAAHSGTAPSSLKERLTFLLSTLTIYKIIAFNPSRTAEMPPKMFVCRQSAALDKKSHPACFRKQDRALGYIFREGFIRLFYALNILNSI